MPQNYNVHCYVCCTEIPEEQKPYCNRIVLQIGQTRCVLDWLTVSVTKLTVAEVVTGIYVNSHVT